MVCFWLGGNGVFAHIGIERVGLNRLDNAVIKTIKIGFSSRNHFDFALPDTDDTPAKGFQFGFVTGVPSYIVLNLLFPEVYIRLWQPEIFTVLMSMPEASVDENDGLILWQDNIRIARQLSDLHTKT